MSKIFVICNENDFANRLKERCEFAIVVTTVDDLTVKIKSPDVCGVVLFVELTWGDDKLHRKSDLWGIEFAKRILRAKEKTNLPILFVSFLPLSQILGLPSTPKMRDPKKEIVTAVGHDFLRLPANPEEWLKKLQNVKRLTDLQLTDIITNFCNVPGLIDEIVHRMQGNLRQLIGGDPLGLDALMEKELRKGLLEIAGILPSGSLNEARIDSVINRFREECLKTQKCPDAINFVGRVGEELKSEIEPETSDQTQVRTSESKELPWRVLILDDEPDSNNVKMIVDTLEKRGARTNLVSLVREAEKMLDDDVNNEIVVAIADYRLNEEIDGIRRHQYKQGYDFLYDISRKDRLTSLVALSGMSRRFLLESFRKYNTRVSVYSKNDLQNQQAINLFVDSMIDLGNETYEALCSIPSSASGWKALKPLYIAYRNSRRYAEWEREVSCRARQYVLIVDSILKSKDIELIQNPPVPELDKLTARMENKDPFNDNNMQVFLNKLVGRRVALWLYYCEGFNAVRIFGALKRILDFENLLNQDGAEKVENKAKNLVNTNLALLLEEFPRGILVEEKRWFKYDMGIDIYNLDELLSQVALHIEIGIKKWLEKNPSAVENLRKKLDLIDMNNNVTILSFEEGKRALRIISESLTSLGEIECLGEVLRAITESIKRDRYSNAFLEDFENYVQKLQGGFQESSMK